MKRRLGSFLVALLLVLSVSAPALAATTSAVDVSAAKLGEQVVVQVSVTAETATNGKLQITYDSASVSLDKYTVADASWIASVNAETAGVVSFAWAGSSLPAESTVMLTLWFDITNPSVSNLTFRASASELYSSGTVMSGSQSSDKAVVSIKETTETPPPITPPITVEPEPEPEPEPMECPFVDIEDHWAEQYIIKAYQNGLVQGVTETTYSPNSTLNRAAFATLLYRLSGCPEVDGENPFEDVADGLWYTKAIIWAYSNGVVKGVSDTKFCPMSTITRQEMVVMLHRYAVLTGRNVDAHANLDDFEDAGSIASWAKEAMEWAVGEGIMIGTGRVLAPREPSYRSQIAVVLVRYADL